MRPHKAACGCWFNEHVWTQLCAEHAREHLDRHTKALKDHQERMKCVSDYVEFEYANPFIDID